MVPPGSAPLPTAISRARTLLVCLYAVYHGALGLLRYESFHSRSLDMAYYVRLVWGLAHGRPDNPIVDAPHWLGLHLEPVLLAFAALARAGFGLPIAETLLVAQVLITTLAFFPAHAMARRRLGPLVGEWGALVAAAPVLLYPAVSRCLDYDFHPSTMLVAPLMAFINAVDAGRPVAAWGYFLVSLCFREDVGLELGLASLCQLLPRRKASVDDAGRPGLGGDLGPMRVDLVLFAIIGFAWFFGYTLFVQPAHLPEAASGSFGAHFERFGGGRGGVGGVLAAALEHPLDLARYLASEDRLVYPLYLALPLALLPLVSPRWLAGALPIIGINLLSDFGGVRKIESHYATAMTPFFVAAAFHGAARLSASLTGWAPELARRPAPVVTLLGLASVLSFWLRGAAPGAPDWKLASYREDDYGRAARTQMAALGDAPHVVAEARVLAHLAEREDPRLDPSQRMYWKH